MTLTIIFAVSAMLHQMAASQQNIPSCLQTCLTETNTQLCSPSALSTLTPCLTKVCPNPPATENLIASLDVAFTPKAEYSCQQSYGPAEGSGDEGSSVTLALNGTCSTSPYGFKSFLPQGVSRIRASNGCRIMVFSEKDCMGDTASSDVGVMSNGRCVFRGGRSARLTCQTELDAARAYIQSNCRGEDNEQGEKPATSSSTVYPSSAPYHGPGPTSSGPSSSTSIPFHWPFSTSTSSNSGSNSTSTDPTNTADATGASTSSTLPPSIPAANATAVLPGPGIPPLNSTQTAPPSNPENITITLSLPTEPTNPAALPTYTGLAARLGVQSAIALGLVGSFFAVFM